MTTRELNIRLALRAYQEDVKINQHGDTFFVEFEGDINEVLVEYLKGNGALVYTYDTPGQRTTVVSFRED
jgi:flagellar hook assembly protein FlgD